MKYIVFIFLINFMYSQDELDLDAMWENTVWEEIKNVETLEFEVEKVTDVAGVIRTFILQTYYERIIQIRLTTSIG